MLRPGRLWVSDGFNTTAVMCAAVNNDVIFTSSSNQATVFFSVAASTSSRPLPARGFWLLYEGPSIYVRVVHGLG